VPGPDTPTADGERPRLTAIEQAVLSFCITLLDHPLESDHYHSAIVSATAVLGIDVEHETWTAAEDYTPKLPGIIKLARMMVVLHAYEASDHHASDPIVATIRRRVERYMMTTKPSPMDWMFMLPTYGLKIRYTSTAGGSISWDGDTVSYQGEKFDMRHFRIRRFKEMFAPLIHISGGQPGRSPDLLSIRCENTRSGGVRNMFVENGTVVHSDAPEI